MPVGTFASAVHIEDVEPPVEDEFDYVLKASGSLGFDTTEKVHSHSTPSMSFTAGNTVLVWASAVNGNNSGTINIMTCAATGWTFARHGNAYRGGAYVCTEAWFVADVPTTGSITFTVGTAVTAFYVHYAVWEITGAALAAVGGVVEPGFSDSQTDGSKSITLNAAPLADSIVFAGLQMDASATAGRSVTPGTGWTEELEINVDTEYGYTQLQTRTGSTSTTVLWNDISATNAANSSGCSAIEIKKGPVGAEIKEKFTYANNASLATASGGAWIDMDGPPVFTVASNAAFYDKAAAGFAYCQVLSNVNLSSPNHYAQADITVTSLVNSYVCVLVRGADLGSGAGSWIEVGISNTNLVIYEVTNLAYSSALVTVAHGQAAPYTKTLKVSMVGSDIIISFGTFGFTFVSTAFPSNVKVGFGCGSQQGSDVIFDNFVADVIPTPDPFDPLTSIPWRTVFWASDPDQSVPSNGANVTTWRQPGAIMTDEWASAGTAPTFVSSWVNGKPCINLGPDSRLVSTYSPANTLYTTVVIVGATTDSSTSDLCDDPVGTQRLLIDRLSGDWRIYRGSSVLSTTGANSNAHLFIARYNNTTGDYLKVDGATRISGTASGTSAGSRIALGSTVSGAHNASRVAFSGVLCNRDLTSTELANLLTWYEGFYKVAPTLVQTWSADYSTATTPKISDSFTWLTGDLFVVMAMSSEAGTGWVAPTATGLSFSAHGTAVTGGTRCNAHKWTATAASGGSGTINAGATGSPQYGYTVWQWRTHGGAGGTTAALGSIAVAIGADNPGAITLGGSKSAVCFIAGDREAVAGGMSLSPSGATERVDGTASQYGFIVGDWIGTLPSGSQTLTIPPGEYASRFMTYVILEVQAL